MWGATGTGERALEDVKHSLDPATFHTGNAFVRTKAGVGEGH